MINPRQLASLMLGFYLFQSPPSFYRINWKVQWDQTLRDWPFSPSSSNLLWCKIHRIGRWKTIDDALYIGPDILTHCRPIIFLLLTVYKAGQLKVSKEVRDHRQVLVSVPVLGRQILITEMMNWNNNMHQLTVLSIFFWQNKAKS